MLCLGERDWRESESQKTLTSEMRSGRHTGGAPAPHFHRYSDVHPSQTELRLFDHTANVANSPPPPKYKYRRRLPHLQKNDADLFITFRTGGPLILPAPARDLVLQHCLREVRIRLLAAVIMPNHVHLLLSCLRDEDGWPFPLSKIMQCLKGATAHRINKLLGCCGPVWQEESFDHVLRSHESLKEKIEYVRQNPMRAGLVKRPEDYPWLWVRPDADSNVARVPSPV
jgi:putative transposase